MTKQLIGIFTSAALLLASMNTHANGDQLAAWANAANQTRSIVGNVSSQRPSSIYPNTYSSQFSNPYAGSSINTTMASSSNYGSGGKERYPIGKPTLECVIAAAQRQNAPVDLLLAINSIERGKTGQFVGNTNGTQDIGAFQINSIHLPRALKYQATREDLATRGCYNAEFAAMLLSEALNHRLMQNKDIYTRAAGYHSWTPKHNAVYRKKLVKYLGEWQSWLRSNNMQNLVTTR